MPGEERAGWVHVTASSAAGAAGKDARCTLLPALKLAGEARCCRAQTKHCRRTISARHAQECASADLQHPAAYVIVSAGAAGRTPSARSRPRGTRPARRCWRAARPCRPSSSAASATSTTCSSAAWPRCRRRRGPYPGRAAGAGMYPILAVLQAQGCTLPCPGRAAGAGADPRGHCMSLFGTRLGRKHAKTAHARRLLTIVCFIVNAL